MHYEKLSVLFACTIAKLSSSQSNLEKILFVEIEKILESIKVSIILIEMKSGGFFDETSS